MKKVALLFIIAVFLPSLVLGWLAIRSVRDQQYLIERQQTVLYQSEADALAERIQRRLSEQERSFHQIVRALIQTNAPRQVAPDFDLLLRESWPEAEVGFVVSLEGEVLAPSLFGGIEARQFRLENDRFLSSRETVEIYWSGPKGSVNLTELDRKKQGTEVPMKKARKVEPAKSILPDQSSSGLSYESARFLNVVGDSMSGTVARFLQDQLKLMFWYRPPQDPQLLFGCQVNLDQLVQSLKPMITLEGTLAETIRLALLNDQGQPVATSQPDLQADWKRPFVATEIGEILPHWELAIYLVNPDQMNQAAGIVGLTLGLLILLLILAIGMGSWLITTDLRRQLLLARQKTDFVSNVSHELKTPLTSIRMFAELLGQDPEQKWEKRKQYTDVINSETARLTRLINNVLDFARQERGETNYRMGTVDLVDVVAMVCQSYRPHLEAHGFILRCSLPEDPITIEADRDALAQVLVNLISNAEKYSTDLKEIEVQFRADSPSTVKVDILDRGRGIPAAFRDKIFEQFYRAHDSLSDGIQGSGLGLTLARQIARAHGGDVTYEERPEGGSLFSLQLPRSNPPNAS